MKVVMMAESFSLQTHIFVSWAITPLLVLSPAPPTNNHNLPVQTKEDHPTTLLRDTVA